MTWKQQQEQLKVLSFLSGLDDTFASARNQLLSGSELPYLNVSFSCLFRIPTAADDHPVDADNVALNTHLRSPSHSSRGRGQGWSWVRMGGGRAAGHTAPNKEDRFCVFRYTPSHVEDKCWKKHGRPKWEKQPSSSDSPPDPALLNGPISSLMPLLLLGTLVLMRISNTC